MQRKEGDSLKLNEKDVVCITRLLQSAMYAEDEGILCGCQYCLYSNECSQNVKNNGGHMYFRDLFKKLHSMTGIDMSPALYATTEIKFLKGSNEINNQGSIAMKAMVKMHDKSRGIPMQNYSRIIVFNNEKTFENILKVNPHLKPLIGVDQQSKKDYPNTYIAGVIRMPDKNNKKGKAKRNEPCNI